MPFRLQSQYWTHTYFIKNETSFIFILTNTSVGNKMKPYSFLLRCKFFILTEPVSFTCETTRITKQHTSERKHHAESNAGIHT